METPTIFAEAPSPPEDDDTCDSEDDTCDSDGVSQRPEEPASEEGFGRDDDCALPEYERLRRENLRKNDLKLQELGVRLLAQSLLNPNATCRTEAGRGEGNQATVTRTRSAGANSIGNRRKIESEGLEVLRRSKRLNNPPPKRKEEKTESKTDNDDRSF